MAGKVFLGLVHYPVYNKNMETVATSITNMDIHDIARSSATYDLEKYFVIHPVEKQHELINEIINYWQEGYGSKYNPDRKEALEKVLLVNDIQGAKDYIAHNYGLEVKVVVTDAREYSNTVTYKDLRQKIEQDDTNILLLFGTGWGIIKPVMESADYILEPIRGRGEYNHLSVRSAVAIILDRLLGEVWW